MFCLVDKRKKICFQNLLIIELTEYFFLLRPLPYWVAIIWVSILVQYSCDGFYYRILFEGCVFFVAFVLVGFEFGFGFLFCVCVLCSSHWVLDWSLRSHDSFRLLDCLFLGLLNYFLWSCCYFVCVFLHYISFGWF